MRVVLLTETFLPKVDGISNTLCHLLDYLAEHEHKSLMFAPVGCPRKYARTSIVALPAFRAPAYPELQIIYPWVDVRQMIRKFNPNILHIVSPFGFTLQGVQIARQLGIPVVASYHTDIPGFAEYWGLGALSSGLWAYFRWVHNQADITFVPTHFTQRQIEAQGFKRVRIWGRGVDTTLYSPTRRSEAWRDRLSDEHPDMPIMLYTGRLAPEKRIELLLPVIQSLHGVRLAIVGDGPQRSQLEKLFAGTPTIFTGYLHGLELAQAYASADIFTFTGAKETFGNVILEAMASGLPVIAPNSGGVIEHIQDGVNGLLYPVGEERALTKTVEHLVHNPGLRQAMAKAAYEYSQHLSWEDIMRHLVDNYQEAHRKPFRQFSAARSQPIV